MINKRNVFTKRDKTKLLETFNPRPGDEFLSVHSIQLAKTGKVEIPVYNRHGEADSTREVPGFCILTEWVGAEGYKEKALAVGARQALTDLQNSGADAHAGAALAMLGTVVDDEYEGFVI